MKGDSNYLWYFESPGIGPKVPIGVYDHEPPDEVPGLKSVNVGGSMPADLARKLTSVVNDVDGFLDSIIPI